LFRLGGIVPTYQYVCTECGGQLEAVQKFTDEPLTVHDCGGRLRKVFSPVGIVFKGSGFYRTDSRGSGSSGASASSSSSKDGGS
jgi:putative FmdB family regulatory protein